MPPFSGGIFNWYRGCMLAYKAPIPIEIARLCGRTLYLFNFQSPPLKSACLTSEKVRQACLFKVAQNKRQLPFILRNLRRGFRGLR